LTFITNRFREVRHVTRIYSHRSPPRPSIVGPLVPSQLWNLLTDEQHQRTLVTLSGIVVRQLDAPLNSRGVHDERS
jgi:hypothetical protein